MFSTMHSHHPKYSWHHNITEWFVFSIGFWFCSHVVAQGTGFRQLTSTYPVAVQRGTQSRVSVRSTFTLDKSHTALFHKTGTRPDIKMVLAESEPRPAPRVEEKSVGTPFQFHVDVSQNTNPGVYEYRIGTRNAVSSVSHLLVTDYPVIREAPENNATPEMAQPVTIPSAVCGICEDFEDIDCYRFKAVAGQELTFQIFAQRVTEGIHDMAARIGIHLMDSMLTLIGPDGKPVAENNNFVGGDSFLAYTIHDTGEYVLQVRDFRYAGDPRYTYCVEISDQPFVKHIFPFAFQKGTDSAVEITGYGPKDLKENHIQIDADEPTGRQDRRIETSTGITNPFPILVTDYPNVCEPESYKSKEVPMAISFPMGVNGQLKEKGERDSFSFSAKKDAHYRFETISIDRGLLLDSVIEIHDSSGKLVAKADDGLHTSDALLLFQAPCDGTFYVSLRDLNYRGGERFLYHLRAEHTGPDFEIHGEYYYGMLAPGTHTIWFARIRRLNGFEGAVKLSVEGLPEGVTCTPVTLIPGMQECGLILSAAADAPISATLARVSGKAMIPDAKGTLRETIRFGRVTCEQRRAGASLLRRWPIQTQIVGVTDPMDILKVETTARNIVLQPGGKTVIQIRIERHPEYQDLVQLDMAFTFGSRVFGKQLPPGISMSKESQVRLTENAVEGTIVLEAAPDALPVARLPIACLARVPVTYSIMTNYASAPVFLSVEQHHP